VNVINFIYLQSFLLLYFYFLYIAIAVDPQTEAADIEHWLSILPNVKTDDGWLGPLANVKTDNSINIHSHSNLFPFYTSFSYGQFEEREEE
jgi:hypothetical protein